MPIPIREDVAYILLKKINETGQGLHELQFSPADFAGRTLTMAELLGHLDYLNQTQFIKAEFTGNAYANQEDVPDTANPQEFDFRIANSFGAADGPLPHLITFKAAEITEKGRKILERMEQNPPDALDEGPAVPIATEDMPFLEKVMIKANLEDIFDARDATEVVFRTMRDMMTKEASDRVAAELHEEMEPSEDKALQNDIADLWNDTNPITRWLSRVRPPLKIKSGNFLFRINQEAGLPRAVGAESLCKAVFWATKGELSEERIQEIATFLPDEIRQLWNEA